MARLKDLYDLIHSLTKTEKRFISVYLKGVKHKSHIRYDDDIKSIKSIKLYNKSELLQQLNNNRQRKNLSEENTNLYNFILDKLQIHHKNNDYYLGFLTAIQRIEILITKRLLDQALSGIKRELKKAKQQDNYIAIQQLLLLQNNIYLLQKRNSENFNNRNDVLNMRIDVLNQYVNNTIYERMLVEMSKIRFENGYPRSHTQISQYSEILNNNLLLDSNKATSKKSLYGYYLIKTDLLLLNYNELEKAYQVANEGLKKIKTLFDLKINSVPELIFLDRCLDLAVKLNHTEAVQYHISQLKHIQPYLKLVGHKSDVDAKIYWSNLYLKLNQKNIKEGVTYFLENETAINELLTTAQLGYLNNYLAARLFFLAKDYNNSLLQLEKVEKHNPKSVISIGCKCLFILNHYKLSNHLLVPSAIRSLYRQLIRQNKMYLPEKTLMLYIKKLASRKDEASNLRRLHAELLELSKDKYNNPFFDSNDILSWIESEISL